MPAHQHRVVIRVRQRQRLHRQRKLHAAVAQHVVGGWHCVKAGAQQPRAGAAAVSHHEARAAAGRVHVAAVDPRLKYLRSSSSRLRLQFCCFYMLLQTHSDKATCTAISKASFLYCLPFSHPIFRNTTHSCHCCCCSRPAHPPAPPATGSPPGAVSAPGRCAPSAAWRALRPCPCQALACYAAACHQEACHPGAYPLAPAYRQAPAYHLAVLGRSRPALASLAPACRVLQACLAAACPACRLALLHSRVGAGRLERPLACLGDRCRWGDRLQQQESWCEQDARCRGACCAAATAIAGVLSKT